MRNENRRISFNFIRAEDGLLQILNNKNVIKKIQGVFLDKRQKSLVKKANKTFDFFLTIFASATKTQWSSDWQNKALHLDLFGQLTIALIYEILLWWREWSLWLKAYFKIFWHVPKWYNDKKKFKFDGFCHIR